MEMSALSESDNRTALLSRQHDAGSRSDGRWEPGHAEAGAQTGPASDLVPSWRHSDQSSDSAVSSADYGSRKSRLREIQSHHSDRPAGNLWQDASVESKYQLMKRTGSWISRTWHFLQTFSLIIIIGVIATLWAVAMDKLMDKLNEAREHLTCISGNDNQACLSWCECIHSGGNGNQTISNPGDDPGLWFGFFCWCALMLLAGYFVANLITLTASGSGIPRMKAVLTGQHIHHFLSLRTLLTKSVGLIFVYASGIPIGREGPYVHLACCIATLLMRTPVYRRYRNSSSRRIDMLTVGLATGVSAAFGAPFGGVIFAVEIVSQYFYVPNLPRMFLAALSGTFVTKMLRSGSDVSVFIALFKTDFVRSTQTKINGSAFAAIIAVGIICGLLSGVFVRLVARIVKIRKEYAPDAHENFKKYLIFFAGCALVLSMFNSLVIRVFWHDLPAMRTQRSLIDKLFLPGNKLDSIMWPLFVLLFANFFMTAASITLPIPAGLFIPVLVIGALVGRFFATAVCSVQYGSSAENACQVIAGYEPGVYAVVGAASFAAGTTRATSTAVIVTEITGQPHLLLPISLGVLAAYFVANRVSKPVYDALIEANHFPVLPKLAYKLGNSPALTYMRPVKATKFLTIKSTIGDAYELLTSPLKWEKQVGETTSLHRTSIPVVRGEDDLRIIGEVQTGALIKVVDVFLGKDGAVAKGASRRRSSYDETQQTEFGQGNLSGADVHASTKGEENFSGQSEDRMSMVLPFAVEDTVVSDMFQNASAVNGVAGRNIALVVDPCPMCVSVVTTLHKVDLLFRSLRLSTLFLVDEDNKFVGIIERDDLVALGNNFQKA
eukprot:g4913.t1